jgi:16S rRNA (uracil1498-N3)-methyltransferase
MSGLRRFYAEFSARDREVTVEGDECFHLKTVIRNRTGDIIEIINGKGNLATGEITDIRDNRVKVRVSDMTSSSKPATRIILAPSLLNKKPMNDLIEKLAEIGVDEIRPVCFKRTEASCSTSTLAKWDRIAIQALKVNKRLWKPAIYLPANIEEILSLAKKTATNILLDLTGNDNPDIRTMPPVLAVVGPPGDFTPEEKTLFEKNGFTGLRINDGTLRTETAAISIGAVLKMKIGTGQTA